MGLFPWASLKRRLPKDTTLFFSLWMASDGENCKSGFKKSMSVQTACKRWHKVKTSPARWLPNNHSAGTAPDLVRRLSEWFRRTAGLSLKEIKKNELKWKESLSVIFILHDNFIRTFRSCIFSQFSTELSGPTEIYIACYIEMTAFLSVKMNGNTVLEKSLSGCHSAEIA